MEQKHWTIYCHIHIESRRRYIGLTSRSVERRWSQHVTQARFSKNGRWHFPNAIRKYGKDAFTHEILEICYTLEKANAAEEKWIEFYDTRNIERGFNLAKGGEHIPHPIRKNPWDDPEYRAKMVEVIKTRWQDPEYRAANLAISRTRLAKATEIASLNKVQSRSEVRQRLSEIMKHTANTPEGRAQRKASAHPGKTLSPEHRAKISANNAMKRPEVQAKVGAMWHDAVKKERIRAKISTGVKAAWNDPVKSRRMMDGIAVAWAKSHPLEYDQDQIPSVICSSSKQRKP